MGGEIMAFEYLTIDFLTQIGSLALLLVITYFVYIFCLRIMKTINNYQKYEEYKNALYIAILKDIAKKQKIDLDEHMIQEDKLKSIDKLIKQRVNDAFNDKIKEVEKEEKG